MYDRAYKLLIEDGYGVKISTPLFYDRVGLPLAADDTQNRYAKKVDIKFSRPNLVFVANECGTNMNMSKDKLSSGNKRAHKKGCNMTIPGCTSDTHFTTL